jgi:hypothetical protein
MEVRRIAERRFGYCYGDIQAESAQKIRAANQDVADKIIDAQEASASKQRAIIIAAYNEAISKKEGPNKFTPEEGPQPEETYSKFGKRREGDRRLYERKIREQQNREGQAATDAANQKYLKAQEETALDQLSSRTEKQSGLPDVGQLKTSIT